MERGIPYTSLKRSHTSDGIFQLGFEIIRNILPLYNCRSTEPSETFIVSI